MSRRKTSGGAASLLLIIVIALSILWMLFRPDLWAWAIAYAVITLAMLLMAHNDGVQQGLESAESMRLIAEHNRQPEVKTEAEAQLEAFDAVMAEANLFAYELKHDLVPDGNSESNPGYGPMDFSEWKEWKQRRFEQTGNPWFNHPDGLPPKENGAV